MSTEDLNKINQWTVDFAQAKIGLKNLEILVHSLTHDQIEVANRLSFLFDAYLKVLDQGESHVAKDQQRITLLKKQLKTFADIERSLHTSVTKFVGKCNAQLESARIRVQTMSQNLTKLKAMKQPQHSMAVQHLLKQVPEFLTVFDSFMARFTLQVRWQQAEYYKKLGEAFTHIGQPEPIKDITDQWWVEFRQIMQAVEALKSVHVQPGFASMKTEDINDSAPTPHARMATESTDSVFSHSVKWINSKVGKEVKNFKFSDPRTGFFNKPTVPPKHSTEIVQATFDFAGETDSDLPFTKGAIITVIDKGTDDDPNWWCGELDGKRGLFPRNYVTEVDADSHPDEYIPRATSEDKVSGQNFAGNSDDKSGEDDFGSFTDAQKPTADSEQVGSIKSAGEPSKTTEESAVPPRHVPNGTADRSEHTDTKTPQQVQGSSNPEEPLEQEHAPKLPSRQHEPQQNAVPEISNIQPPELPARDKTSFEQIHNDSPSKSPSKTGPSNSHESKKEVDTTMDKLSLSDNHTAANTDSNVRDRTDTVDKHVDVSDGLPVSEHTAGNTSSTTAPASDAKTPEGTALDTKASSDNKSDKSELDKAELDKSLDESIADTTSAAKKPDISESKVPELKASSESRPTELQQTSLDLHAKEKGPQDPIDELL